jgi:hypothetical protein
MNVNTKFPVTIFHDIYNDCITSNTIKIEVSTSNIFKPIELSNYKKNSLFIETNDVFYKGGI